MSQVGTESSEDTLGPLPAFEGEGSHRRWRTNSMRGLRSVDLSNVTILVVDDDAVQRTILAKWLKDGGYRNVTLVGNAEIAWKLLTETQTRFDLVVTDLMMPGITGATLLEMIKTHPRYHSLPVILMSGEDKTPETAASAIREGSHDFLFKPLIRDLFIRKIATVLENLLIKEREVVFENLMIEKDLQILKLTNENLKVMKAIETPIEGITKTLSKVLQDKSLQNLAVKKDLEDVFFTIRTNRDLYAPVIKELLKQDMNPEAKSLLLSCTEAALGRRTSLPTFPIVVKEESVAGLKNWDFPIFDYNEKDLLPLVKSMFEDFDLIERFQIPVQNLERFIMAVRDGYQNNPYHNFTHAFDVTQTVYCFLTTMGAATFLTHLDILGLLIAALCHDLHHPGLTNAYLIESEDELALLYNDKSVLESHHAASAFKLLRKPECDIVKNLAVLERKELRSAIITPILATDMQMHFSHTAKLEQRINSGKPFDRDSKEDRVMIMETMLKCADISNIAKPWDRCREWGMRIGTEYFKQGDRMLGEGRTPAEFLDKRKTTYARNTANFMDLFGTHLFDILGKILPNAKTLHTYLCDNRLKWGEIINQVTTQPNGADIDNTQEKEKEKGEKKEE